ncbi:UDP-glucose dehydrogenase family protein [Helicobacter typhlonius]|uniref:UDP-glucose 6-dehydrogenase n=3 Tax=Helicobacter typhlonius TaxID=76936 RepID=A0A099UF74_9HELI|nr:UDP-glucose/GDP-mannose dehydrogenase family protein [Helicobacter typhlonius]TLD79221.1 UDP-glucose/GDP-mannose dehydrogenase family protein [Helicobacter typhlonius]CUU40564.1 UDP-glucose dehydrogenase [Helicobacter typhlonius]HCD73744.1 UDP-glucose/GDP-mannose dehydrogenase family protein [Helicobacter sp.]
MQVSVVGSGYVGLVAGACFAQMGNNVTCLDVDSKKIERLKQGEIPIYEPGLESMVKDGIALDTLHFTTNKKVALESAEVIFVAVGTPMGEDGSADLSYVEAVARDIGTFIKSPYVVVVNKSTVPVGSAKKVRDIIESTLKERNVAIGDSADYIKHNDAKNPQSMSFDVVSNPEFLKEGVAIKDFMSPDRVVIGTDSKRALEVMKALYAPFLIKSDRFIAMGIESAEMTKYAANAMLATKISFINEMSQICERVGANINDVRLGIGSDSRIGYSFIYPGCGYGGSCFPKDVRALEKTAQDFGYRAQILSAVQVVNEAQKMVLVEKITRHFGEDLSGKSFGIWGLSFKPETDDMREASSLVLVRELVKRGAKIKAYDPKAQEQARFYFKDYLESVEIQSSKYDALKNCAALVLLTEWREFRSPDFGEIKKLLENPVIFDGRNIYQSLCLESKGFVYYQIGVKNV